MRKVHAITVGAILAAAVVVVTLASANAATTPSAPYDSVSFDASSDSSGLPPGFSTALDDSNASFDASSGSDITAQDAAHELREVFMSPPEGSNFSVGTYSVHSGGNATDASIMIRDSTLSPQADYVCYGYAGSLTIDQLTKDAQNDITAFAAHFTINCEEGGPVGGEVRWHSSLDYIAAKTGAGADAFGDGFLGAHSAVKVTTVTSAGSKPVHLGTPKVTGSPAFAMTSDTCAGATLSYGQTCTIGIQSTPTTSGALSGTLTIPADVVGGQLAVALTASGVFDQTDTYHAADPVRLLDTRSGVGAPVRALGPNSTLSLQVTGRFSILPGTITAVVLNLTVTQPTASSYLTVYPSGVARPTASNINFVRGFTGANSVTVKLGTDGKINIYNQAGSTQIIADLDGYYLAHNVYVPSQVANLTSGQFHAVTPFRMLDTRTKVGGAIPARTKVLIYADFGAADGHISALVANLTAVKPAKSGYLTAWTGFGSVPTASTLNFTPGSTVSNLAVIGSTTCNGFINNCGDYPAFTLYNASTAPVDVLVDVFGVFDDNTLAGGATFKPMTPTRIVDTRSGSGARALGAGTIATVTVPSSMRDPATVGTVLNVTAVKPTAPTFLTIWGEPDAAHRPTVSNLNPSAGRTLATGAASALSGSGNFYVYNYKGSTNFLVDVDGLFELDPFVDTPTPRSGAATVLKPLKVGSFRPAQ